MNKESFTKNILYYTRICIMNDPELLASESFLLLFIACNERSLTYDYASSLKYFMKQRENIHAFIL